MKIGRTPESFAGIFLLFCWVALTSSCGGDQVQERRTEAPEARITPYEFQKRFRVAIFRFENQTKSRLNEHYLEPIQEGLMAALLKTGRLRLIERGKINALLKEHQLAQTGVVDYKNAKKIGRMLSADALLVGSLLTVDTSINIDEFMGAKKKEYVVRVTMSGRIIDVETSEVLATDSIEATRRATEEKNMLGVESRSINKNKVITDTVKDATRKLADRLASMVPEKPETGGQP